jgi:protein gp37
MGHVDSQRRCMLLHRKAFVFRALRHTDAATTNRKSHAIPGRTKTWNPNLGCTKVSLGCKHCYAERMSCRLKGAAEAQPTRQGRLQLYRQVIGDDGHWNHQIQLMPEALQEPFNWPPCAVFVNSMSDLFHEQVPSDWIHAVFEVMTRCPQHTFQVLTKRAVRLTELAPQLPWTSNIWMGVSVETAAYTKRIDLLRQTPATVKFLSLEPLLGPIPDLDLNGIQWVITGGESGAGSRPCQPEWFRQIRDRCIAQHIPIFLKQWGKLRWNPDPSDPTAKENGGKSKGGRLLDRQLWNQRPGVPATSRNSTTEAEGQIT